MNSAADALPQADRLDLVRAVVEAISQGHGSTESVASATRLTSRYAQFALQAARLLGLLDAAAGGESIVTAAGIELLATQSGGAAERECFRAALSNSPLQPALILVLGDEVPSAADIADVLMSSRSVARSTALRRARTLLAWRRFILAEHSDDDRDDDRPASASKVSALPSEVPLPDSVMPPPAETESAPVDMPPPSLKAPARSSRTPAAASSAATAVNHNDLAYLRRHLEQGNLLLFTGAGFSLGAIDVAGQRLPTAADFGREVWDLAYPGEEQDGSTLQDIFEQAQRLHRKPLEAKLKARFTVDASKLPGWYETWLSLPWLKAYTLNVDDLVDACNRRFDALPRELRSISALGGTPRSGSSGGAELEVVHLNGIAKHGVDGVTFSGQQYAERLSRGEPFYLQLRAEMLTRPFVFVGSVLEESLLWQHLAIRGRKADDEQELRPKSFLISPSLSRARVDKLRAHNITWINATAESFAAEVLSPLQEPAQAGLRRLRHNTAAARGDETSVVEVATALNEPDRRTSFLLGAEPRWTDIRTGRAVERDHDRPVLEELLTLARSSRSPSDPLPVVVVTGTAGAGKTTLLMKGAVHLNNNGHRVAWITSSSEVSPRSISKYFKEPDRPRLLFIDDAGRFGTQLVGILSDLAKVEGLDAVAVTLRAHHHSWVEEPGCDPLDLRVHRLGGLTDADIQRLLLVLEQERLLGALTGKPLPQRIAAFRDRADRQILVAMIEATSGEKFEDKIVREWSDQDELGRYVYALVALATTHGYPLDRAEVMLASSQTRQHELEAVNKLTRAHLLVEDDAKRLRVRHRVIADRLVDELTARGTQIEQVLVGLCRAIAIGTSAESGRSSRRRRVLSRLLSHDTLLRWLADVEPARSAYAQLEDYLAEDHHFWLQRGCLELEAGELAFAKNYLESARALNTEDALVDTAFAHMQLRTAIANPSAHDSAKLVSEALDQLRRLISSRGKHDYRPAHVFGSQVLAWCRRAALTPRARRDHLVEAKDILAAAIAAHKGRHELKTLYDALRKEELQPR